MTVRFSSDKQRNSLKMAFRVSVEQGGGGKIVSEMTRVTAPMISLYCASHEHERFPGVDVALDLDLAVGAPVNARALASAQGYELVPMTESAGTGRLGLGDLSSVMREAHDVERQIVEALDDGVVTENERLAITKDIQELMSVLSSIQRKVSGA
ncbi:hypothetical protein SAMN05428967_4450 [Phyllobacterium sp. YR620]|uniref:phage regulatory CII family protein n=1 Tax=Phyllobacterium sp. YR620 TaxID=1881066 RepID=UPI00088CDAC7|nr:phage regulatory CII family protein [Phyllobacterium sp. YR620]SDP92362.1 hypothetical protein SAMN05428967_4450 [Phyllobacterium sp. YR620]